ncbi:hypothetical protein [Elizabethkingia anophelis]|uniref:Uncharacterized protein n=1 Tax=Elizabethkingia anophelis TaxID=1117645 RepID=A0AAU8UQ64_9FLAO|nr:hypothetical protein [Elizabethkingia anophelis]AQX00448.1 hypothetical protein BBD32_02695 [Elizabethkingia anophelis]OPB66216.1 hypothetical protein BAY11_14725 [Elizabethkingia anophelis]
METLDKFVTDHPFLSLVIGIVAPYIITFISKALKNSIFGNLKIPAMIFTIIRYFIPVLLLVYYLVSNNLEMNARNVISLIVIIGSMIYQLLMDYFIKLQDQFISKIEDDNKKFLTINEFMIASHSDIEKLKDKK